VDQLFNSSEERVARTLLILANSARTVVRGRSRHASASKTDILGRVGGEEFAAALTETDLSRALQTAERLRRVVAEEPFDVGESRLRLTISVGVAARRGEDSDPGELLKLADRALYAAKAKGRNQVVADAR
jgi:diguanylate cyclase (GGDEF)-like protein